MNISDSGVLAPSFMDFTIPSGFAMHSLYYVPQFGHFYCTDQYRIDRDSLDLFLCVYVCSGSLFFESDGKQFTAVQDQIAFLDCRKPHCYYCTGSTEFLWFHFNGSSSADYVNFLTTQSGSVFSGDVVLGLRRSFERIFAYAQEVPSNEHLISLHVTQILGRLASPQKRTAANQALEPAIRHIRENFSQPIALDELASLCSMSTSHFIRSFSKYVNSTPHEYLLAYRLRQAKQLLLTTDESVEQIAEQCGFNSASHFSRAFRKSNGISPTEFRSIQF
ncbi:MAG: AraC family transcriptional regulator [Butyricicoccus sp.]